MLQLKLTNEGLSQDGTTIILQDNTGAYDAVNNPGGYGAPNPIAASADIALLRFSLYRGNTTEKTVTVAEMQAGRIFKPFDFGLTADPDGSYLLPDGVEVFEYLVGFSQGVAVTLADKVITTVGLTIPSELKYVALGADLQTLYEVDKVLGNTILLKEVPDDSDLTDITFFYSSVLYVLVDTYIQSRIDKAVIAISNCESSVDIMEDVLNTMGAASRFAIKDYQGAQDSITVLNQKYNHDHYRVQY